MISKSNHGRRKDNWTKYPWAEWFDRRKKLGVKLRRGTDYNCMPHSMIGNIRAAAKAAGIRVHISLEEDNSTLTVKVAGRIEDAESK